MTGSMTPPPEIEPIVPREHGEQIAPVVKYRAFKRFRSNKGAIFGTIFLIVITILCSFPWLINHYPQNDQDPLSMRLRPSGSHWLGTDILGRDQMSELLHAGLISIRIAIMVAIIATLVGATLGAIAGYKGGFIDSLVMRTADLFLTVPQLIALAIALNKYGHKGDFVIAIAEAIVFWPSIARYVRGNVLSIKSREYVDAAKVSGRGTLYIVFRHLIPNSWSIIAVASVLAVANAILLESTLSFLGFGVQPPKTSWGLMLQNAKGSAVGPYWYLFFAPGIAIFLTVLAFNFIGDGLRDALDPRSEQS
jgi:peptide/nickel transport system permease protein